jgi:predicted dehydrogenase
MAVIGAGAIGRKHIETIRSEPLAELVATADPVAQADFADYREMLAKVKPEAVVIATPNAEHGPVGLACVEAGVPMLVEKPIAETVEAANRLVEAAERAGVALLVGHHRRHNPIVEKAREVVQGGRLGRLTTVAALFLLQKPADYFDVAWRREPGGGPLLINLIHDVDNLRFICGEIAEVQAMSSNAIRGFGVEDSAAVTFRFAGGALGTATVSDAVAAPWSWEISSGENPIYPREQENCYLFSGTGASLALPALDLWSYEGKRGWHAPLSSERLQVTHEDPLVRQMRHFCRVARGQEKPRVTGADATRTLAVTLAIHEAAASRRPVILPA